MRLNLNVVPVFQTMSDPGLGIPALPHKPADVHIFLRDLVCWDHDILKFSIIRTTRNTVFDLLRGIVFPATMQGSYGKKFPVRNPAIITEEDLLKLILQFSDAEIALLIEDA